MHVTSRRHVIIAVFLQYNIICRHTHPTGYILYMVFGMCTLYIVCYRFICVRPKVYNTKERKGKKETRKNEIFINVALLPYFPTLPDLTYLHIVISVFGRIFIFFFALSFLRLPSHFSFLFFVICSFCFFFYFSFCVVSHFVFMLK